jgi:hypothetical protein
MIRVHYPYPTNGRPAATFTVPRRGQQDIQITIEYGADKYDTFKLVVTPSRAVNPPFGQYIGGVDRQWNQGFKDSDDRVEVTKVWVASALEGVASKGHITAAQSQLKNMFKKLDKAPHKEPITAASRKAS